MSTEAGNAPLPPTTTELKKLVEEAQAGSKAAEEKLQAMREENAALRARIEKLEAAAVPKEPASAAAQVKKEPAPEEVAKDVDDFDLLGGW